MLSSQDLQIHVFTFTACTQCFDYILYKQHLAGPSTYYSPLNNDLFLYGVGCQCLALSAYIYPSRRALAFIVDMGQKHL